MKQPAPFFLKKIFFKFIQSIRSEGWIAWKLWWTRKTLFGGSAPLSLIGLVLGVACLVASMAVVSGFESSLKSAMVDVTGHMTLMKRDGLKEDWQELENKIKSIEPTLISAMRFTYTEGVIAKKGQVLGVMVQGVDPDRYEQVLNLTKRSLSGSIGKEALLKQEGGAEPLFIGKGIAQRFGLAVGDRIRIIVMVSKSVDPNQLDRRMGEFYVSGVLDLGKYEWNQRYVLTSLSAAQKLAQIPKDRFTGLVLKFLDADHAPEAVFNLNRNLHGSYYLRDWKFLNSTLFEAVHYEKIVIFFVVLVIVFVSAFNISSAQFVSVVRRYSDIAILKTLGMPPKKIMGIYTLQGFMLALTGLLGGLLLGLILCFLFSYYQTRLGLLNGDVYKLDSIQLELKWIDLSSIFFSTLLICFIATLAPARRGARLSPMEGLRHA